MASASCCWGSGAPPTIGRGLPAFGRSALGLRGSIGAVFTEFVVEGSRCGGYHDRTPLAHKSSAHHPPFLALGFGTVSEPLKRWVWGLGIGIPCFPSPTPPSPARSEAHNKPETHKRNPKQVFAAAARICSVPNSDLVSLLVWKTVTRSTSKEFEVLQLPNTESLQGCDFTSLYRKPTYHIVVLTSTLDCGTLVGVAPCLSIGS